MAPGSDHIRQGPKADVCHECTCSPDLHPLGSGMGPWLCFQLPLLTCFFCPHFLLPGAGGWDMVSLPPASVSSGRLAGSGMSHTQGCPGLCPHFGGPRLVRVARVHGQQGRVLWLSPQRALQLHGGCGWALSSWAAMGLSLDSACSPLQED